MLLGASPAAAFDATGFLDRYVKPDGRVVRIDQGGDTVSAGQAQGLLIAAALHERAEFVRIWHWTRRHLQLRDHLLASRWKDGHIVNSQPASDADLDAARALLLAGFKKDALQIAYAVLANETVARGGVDVLVAGPWARLRGIVDPGYWAPRTLELLSSETHDRRFVRLESGELKLAGELTHRAPHLPPDWAAVSSNGSVHPIAAPRGHQPAPPQFSLDAARLPIRFEEACNTHARGIAAASWPFFAAQGPAKTGSAYRSMERCVTAIRPRSCSSLRRPRHRAHTAAGHSPRPTRSMPVSRRTTATRGPRSAGSNSRRPSSCAAAS